MTFPRTAAAILFVMLLTLATACSQLPAQEDVDPLRDNCARANDVAQSMTTLCLYEDDYTLSGQMELCNAAIRAINATTKACTAYLEH